MASELFNCEICGVEVHRYGDGNHELPVRFDHACEEHVAEWRQLQAEKAIVAAEAAVVAAEDHLAQARRDLVAAKGGNLVAGGVGRGTVAELRAYASAHEIDLEGASRKDEIEDLVFPQMTVAELREHARANDIDLEGATRKDDIIARLKGQGPPAAVTPEAEPVAWTTTAHPSSAPTSEWTEEPPPAWTGDQGPRV